ncbi:protein LIFEGUARD 2-like [Lolium rigidum]|uniref:protein LIFEGUARD 2-like n=1 Tax=Lolium rigidum TaxID=89674 RepID=UPI001F5E09CF|nr:protein LIFEGUARD 2-like [Lolium rigidum]
MSKLEVDPELGAAAEKPAAAARVAAAPKKVAEEEDPRLRWAFVRKVYAILALQFAFTAALAAVACLVHPIPRFFLAGSVASWSVFITIILAPFLVMWPMLKYRQKHPVNLWMLALFTLCISISVAVTSSTVAGKALLQAAILTAVAVAGLTLFTFWAANRGYDFTFMFPFLFTSLLVLLVYLLIQMFVPLGRVGVTIYGCVATVLFSAFIVFDTNMLVKHHTYNEYVVAAISLYLDVINLFMAQLSFAAIQ